MYDKSVAKVNDIHTSGFVSKTPYNTNTSSLERKINDADKKLLVSVGLLKKQIITQKYQTLKKNILQRLIIVNLQMIYLMQR